MRIAISRALSRHFLGRPEMLCAISSWHAHPSRHLLNALFLDRGHCASAADYEARQEREATLLDEWREAGWL